MYTHTHTHTHIMNRVWAFSGGHHCLSGWLFWALRLLQGMFNYFTLIFFLGGSMTLLDCTLLLFFTPLYSTNNF